MTDWLDFHVVGFRYATENKPAVCSRSREQKVTIANYVSSWYWGHARLGNYSLVWFGTTVQYIATTITSWGTVVPPPLA